jgi:hypothetical protein
MPGPGGGAFAPAVSISASSSVLAAEAVAESTRMTQVPPASAPANGTGVLAPWVATGCRIAMGITMTFMLVIMI